MRWIIVDTHYVRVLWPPISFKEEPPSPQAARWWTRTAVLSRGCVHVQPLLPQWSLTGVFSNVSRKENIVFIWHYYEIVNKLDRRWNMAQYLMFSMQRNPCLVDLYFFVSVIDINCGHQCSSTISATNTSHHWNQIKWGLIYFLQCDHEDSRLDYSCQLGCHQKILKGLFGNYRFPNKGGGGGHSGPGCGKSICQSVWKMQQNATLYPCWLLSLKQFDSPNTQLVHNLILQINSWSTIWFSK